MTTKLVRLRRSAFVAQSGLCYYCDLPMWESDRESFARTYNIKPTQAQPRKCTAEHLEAQKDGGNDTKQNIVAACRFCNVNRHRRKKAPGPGAFRQFVQRRLSNGRWHCRSLMKIFKPLAALRLRRIPNALKTNIEPPRRQEKRKIEKGLGKWKLLPNETHYNLLF